MSAHADEFQALSDTLYHWSVFEPSVKCEIGCSALKLPSGWVVVDPVPLAPAAWEELLALAPLRAILLTNDNHVRDALALKKQHAVPVVTAADTRRDITELRPDITLLPNEFLYGITAIAIPGVTPGETAFFSETGVMLLGDAVINTSTERGLELLPDKYCADAKQNRASLRNLLQFDFHTLTFAHGAPVTAKAKQKLSALLET
jgi:glyoxylase-like metal-dependent hydrolase (beta-lactamase superfamily II)